MLENRYLFRGKRINNGEWVEGGFTLDAIDNPRITTKTKDKMGLIFHEVTPESVGQFTGMVDKKGVKIFEGDILSIKEYDNKSFDDDYILNNDEIDLFSLDDLRGDIMDLYISDISYNEGTFLYKSKNKGYYDSFICGLFGDMRLSQPIFDTEVIGNIHDNPELLNK